jgi:cell division protein FtsQ
MWSLQMKTGPESGAWTWLNFKLEPWESPNSPYFGASMAALAAVAWLLLVSPVLALDLDQLDIQGQGTVVDAAVVHAVVAPQDGTPLPRLDTVALRRAVLDVPGVRAAEVARIWPHGLRITVISREPVAAVPQTAPGQTGFALLDVEGIQVGRADVAPEGLPVISVPLDDPQARAMTAVLTVLQTLPPDLAAEVATASADSQDTVVFVLRDGATVQWGRADQSALKLTVLQTLRTAEASRSATVFDVSAPTLPITKS